MRWLVKQGSYKYFSSASVPVNQRGTLKLDGNKNTELDPGRELVGSNLFEREINSNNSDIIVWTDEVIEVQPAAAPSFDFESFHRNMNERKMQTAQDRNTEMFMSVSGAKNKNSSLASSSLMGMVSSLKSSSTVVRINTSVEDMGCWMFRLTFFY